MCGPQCPLPARLLIWTVLVALVSVSVAISLLQTVVMSYLLVNNNQIAHLDGAFV